MSELGLSGLQSLRNSGYFTRVEAWTRRLAAIASGIWTSFRGRVNTPREVLIS